MSTFCVQGGTVYDPANGIDGVVRDLLIRDGKIVNALGPQDTPDEILDARGLIVMPGGVDVHSHIAGLAVNHGRTLYPKSSLPTPSIVGRLYAGLGYTTAIDAAIAPVAARHAHFDFAATEIIDKAFLILAGNHAQVLRTIAAGQRRELRALLSWLVRATRGFGLKIVNPGGVEHWNQTGTDIGDIDSPVATFGTSPRQIMSELADAATDLQLPHAVHIHCNHLGMAGNWETTLATMKALAGRRAHFAHVQFHSYGGAPDDGTSFCSRARELVQEFERHSELTADIGQVMFGPALGLTADTPLAHYLHRVTGGRLSVSSMELEGGCGIVPIEYKDTSFINAIQWAIGLEWLLLVKDPWRIALSTDHPNGASFLAYPEIVHLLMDRDYRRAAVRKMPARARERTALGDLDREYTLGEIAIIARAAPARILGLQNKGRLGEGADADIAVYAPNSDRRKMFELPRYVLKAGRIVIDREEPRGPAWGTTFHAAPDGDDEAAKDWLRWLFREGTIQPEHYAIRDDELRGSLTRVSAPGTSRSDLPN